MLLHFVYILPRQFHKQRFCQLFYTYHGVYMEIPERAEGKVYGLNSVQLVSLRLESSARNAVL